VSVPLAEIIDPLFLKEKAAKLDNLDAPLSSRASEATLQQLERDVVVVRGSSFTVPSGYSLIVHAASEMRLFGDLIASGDIVAAGDLVVH